MYILNMITYTYIDFKIINRNKDTRQHKNTHTHTQHKYVVPQTLVFGSPFLHRALAWGVTCWNWCFPGGLIPQNRSLPTTTRAPGTETPPGISTQRVSLLPQRVSSPRTESLFPPPRESLPHWESLSPQRVSLPLRESLSLPQRVFRIIKNYWGISNNYQDLVRIT